MVTTIVVGVAVVLWIVSLELVFRFGMNRGRKQVADKIARIIDGAVEMLREMHEDADEEVKPQAKRKTPKRDAKGHFIKITKGTKKK